MDADAIRLMYDYSYWATGRILDAARHLDAGQFSARPALAGANSLQHILVHTLDCETGWRETLEAKQPSSTPELDPADFPDVETLAAAWKQDEAVMRGWLSSLDDNTVTSPVFTGRLLWEHLLHVTNHGTQHRSEAAMILTAYGQSPGDLDLAVYLRSGHDR